MDGGGGGGVTAKVCLQLEKALLLCALLQGFGMDAYVCSGTVAHKQAPAEARYWCMTVSAPERVTFWDAVSGETPPFVYNIWCVQCLALGFHRAWLICSKYRVFRLALPLVSVVKDSLHMQTSLSTHQMESKGRGLCFEPNHPVSDIKIIAPPELFLYRESSISMVPAQATNCGRTMQVTRASLEAGRARRVPSSP